MPELVAYNKSAIGPTGPFVRFGAMPKEFIYYCMVKTSNTLSSAKAPTKQKKVITNSVEPETDKNF